MCGAQARGIIGRDSQQIAMTAHFQVRKLKVRKLLQVLYTETDVESIDFDIIIN